MIGGAAVIGDDQREGDFRMMHPNWLLIAAILGLGGPLSLHASNPAVQLAHGVEYAIANARWQDFRTFLVCSEGDPLAPECRSISGATPRENGR